ncbi:hypothetical protein [Streptomyces sp. NPDC058579]|uniref:hypothetical protein n=1 Tax=Streptomyces sp. NPDC058579 TaxID=3346548 RepID=UPI0036564A11
MPEKDPCDLLKGTPVYEDCVNPDAGGPTAPGPPGAVTDGAAEGVQKLARDLIEHISALVAPGETWVPRTADSDLYAPFLWLGQHLAVAVFICVVVVCGLTAWQGAPRLRQMGHSTGWTLVAVAGMALVPGTVTLLNKAVSEAFTALLNSNEMTLFATIKRDMASGADAQDPLAILIIVSALVVALAFAALVFMTRQPAVLVFVCIAPLVLGSLARGGDTSALQRWAHRLLGLLFAPLALILVSPFVALAKGSLVMDAVMLVAADVVMLRMIFHGVPYIGPRLARAARALVEQQTNSRVIRAVVRAGVPDVYEQENTPRGPRVVPTPGRGMSQDADGLFAAYGAQQPPRPGRLTAPSAIEQTKAATERTAQICVARREARAAHQQSATTSSGTTPAIPAARPAPPPTRPASAPAPAPGPRPDPAPTQPPTP